MASNNKRLYYILGGILVLAVVGAVVARRMGWVGGTKPTEVILAKAQRTEIVEKVSASGKVQPEMEVKISPLVSGEVIDVLVQEGDSVVAGQMLARIKPDNLKSVLERVTANLNAQKANLSQARARLESAKATLIRRKQELERAKTLHRQKAISDSDLETAQSNHDIAEAELKAAEQSIESSRFAVLSAEAQVKEANENLSFTSISAPMSGIISKLGVEKGERVVGTSQMAGTEMLRIADLSSMEVRVDVNENDIIRVNVGDTCIVEVDSYTFQNLKFKGIVTLIANSAKETPGTTDAITEFEVRIRILPNSYATLLKDRKGNPPFRPGMTASVEIITERRGGVLSVPLAAVTTRTEEKKEGASNAPAQPNANTANKTTEPKEDIKEVVFLNDNGTAKMVEVKTGISDYDNIEIVSGIKEGDEIVAGPFLVVSKTLKNGDKIVPQKEPDANKKKD